MWEIELNIAGFRLIQHTPDVRRRLLGLHRATLLPRPPFRPTDDRAA